MERIKGIQDIPLSKIDPFPDHPYKVRDDEDMEHLVESIRANGIITPCIVRPKKDGRFEMISGHRRLMACKNLGLETIPCRIRDLTDDEAIIYMVDSNLHREKLLPSEKAYAYKMKLEAMKHQGTYLQDDETSRQLGDKLKSVDILSSKSEDSARQIHRYIRLTYLIPELLQMVDNAELKENPSIALNPAVNLSYLTKEEQKMLAEYIEFNLVTPSLEQAIKLKELSKGGILKEENIETLLDVPKANQIQKFKINEEKLFNVVPKNIERDKLEDFVIKACEFYSKHLRNKERER